LNDYIFIAEISSVVGSKGTVSLKTFSGSINRFANLEKVYIDVFGDYREFFIEEVSKHNNKVILKFCNFNSDQDVKFLIGEKIYADLGILSNLPENDFEFSDLIGSEVFCKSKFFGYLKDVLCLPANDVYVIEDKNGKEVLIPVIEDYIDCFESVKKRLILKERCESIYDED
jgi:16S rRNA processing protein RimM